MSWRQFVRALEKANAADRRLRAAHAREERESMRRYRALVRDQREAAKQEAKAQAAEEVAQYESYLEALVSLHKECSRSLNWKRIAALEPPTPPSRGQLQESSARADLDGYKPTLADRLFGGAKKKTAALEQAIVRGREVDDATHAEAMRQHQEALVMWEATRALAARMIARDSAAYATALVESGSFDELGWFQTQIKLAATEDDAVVFSCSITDDELVPSEEIKLTSTGKLSSKSLPAGRYWALYQDHVCSMAIRVAREAFAVLPISRAIVNIETGKVSSQTGHREAVALLAVHFTRDGIERLNLAQIDPSDSMKNFPHRMKFKKTAGFDPIEPMSLDENWVTT